MNFLTELAGKSYKLVFIRDVTHCIHSLKYTTAYTRDSSLDTQVPLSAIATHHPDFIYVNRNAIVRKSKIIGLYREAIPYEDHANFHVRIKGTKEIIKVSRRRVSTLRKLVLNTLGEGSISALTKDKQ